jgi:hypothetical protein
MALRSWLYSSIEFCSLHKTHIDLNFFFREKIFEPSIESKVRVVVAITTLLKHAPGATKCPEKCFMRFAK